MPSGKQRVKKVSAEFCRAELGVAGTIHFKVFYDSRCKRQEFLSGFWMNTKNRLSWEPGGRGPPVEVCGDKEMELNFYLTKCYCTPHLLPLLGPLNKSQQETKGKNCHVFISPEERSIWFHPLNELYKRKIRKMKRQGSLSFPLMSLMLHWTFVVQFRLNLIFQGFLLSFNSKQQYKLMGEGVGGIGRLKTEKNPYHLISWILHQLKNPV